MNTRIKAEKLKEDFQKSLEETANKNYLIEREISSIQKFVYEEPRIAGALKLPVYDFKSIFSPFELSSATHYPFTEAFDHFILDKKSKFEEENQIQEYQKITVKEAEQFSEYYKYLDGLLKDRNRFSNKKKTGLSHKQKLLALHYLGLDTSKFDNTAVAKILSEVLELSEDNTRQYLSYISAGKNNIVRTKANLEKLDKLFENQGLTDISLKIRSDIEKI